MGLAKKMGDKHEEHAAEVYGGRMTPGSGNQWNRPTDGRISRYEHTMAFARDCKSTRARSMTIKRDDLDKLQEQAQPERPMMPIRFYDDDRLRSYEDWLLLTEDDGLELMARSEKLDILTAAIEALSNGVSITEVFPGVQLYDGEMHAVVSSLKALLR